MLKVDFTAKIDFQKIKNFMSESAVEILVGYPSGRQHNQAIHKNPEGEYRNYDGSAPAPAPLETAELAKMLYYGTADIPARPFLSDGIEDKKREIYTAFYEELSKVATGDGSPNWDKIGAMSKGAIQEFVRSDFYKSSIPNGQKTIDYKGSDTPLIDSADMLNATDYEVRKGN